MSTVGAVILAAAAILLWPPMYSARVHALDRPDSPDGARPDSSCARRLVHRLVMTRRGRAPNRVEIGSAGDSALALDLLGACLAAGMPVPTAVSAVARVATDPVAGLLRDASHALALGATPEVAWQRARDHPAIADLARAACRTAASGSALARQTSALADRLRLTEADQLEAQAQRASVLVVGPLGLCFLPAFLCLGVIPVVLGLASRLHVLP
ncbi:type II secretion system F family protein [Saccharomonospora xinjiangensis]|uniref:Flp pilus assembly protein TadC n=1 Tax=Saccharomonospora xinjiangensis XJ-54 TaxID=882086 RepID=I0V3M0_9PSEU|nr:type II secretion system F family protein [Saccharomonospora xinjiangensis]EID54723.1 Flp pilus assembly protein TadC [Saccharomonospora xinjiangensis XJ-54]